ncbi:MAG TPA: hypothetical protein VGI58_03360 [Streptosporangiaceae bacterium]
MPGTEIFLIAPWVAFAVCAAVIYGVHRRGRERAREDYERRHQQDKTGTGA